MPMAKNKPLYAAPTTGNQENRLEFTFSVKYFEVVVLNE